jgi:hypothetical protein
MWHHEKPDVSHLRIFGTISYIHIPKAERRKLDSKSLKCYFVGYSPTQKAYRFWDPVSRRIKISRDVIFDEQLHDVPDIPTNHEEANPFEVLFRPSREIQSFNNNEEGGVMPQAEGESDVNTQPETSHTPPSSDVPTRVVAPTLVPSYDPDPAIIDDSASISSGITRVSPYPLRIREPRRHWQSMQSTTEIQDLYVPTSYSDAMACPNAHLWKAAIEDEYNSLMVNKTWSISQLPPGRTPIGSRWVFTIKPGVKGSPPRYKARLVAKGFSQRHGIDYEETFSPVVKYDTLRVILSFVAANDLEMSQLDVKTAFLYGQLDEEIYLVQPEGFILSGQEDSVCHLHKCLYGLKQASRVWNQTFDTFLKKFGLLPSISDPCLYLRHLQGEFLAVVIWVDDGLVCSNNANVVKSVIEDLNKYFDMHCTPANHFVGLSITRDRQARTLYVSQPDYIKRILHRFHMSDCNPRKLPAEPGNRLSKKGDEVHTEEVPFREAVGSLLYLSIASRPDIAFAVGQISQFCEDPGREHWLAALRIFAYLKGTLQHGIRYGPKTDGLQGFSDSDYAGDPVSRRSTSGFVVLLHGGPVAWKSRRQSCVVLSTTEAELVATCEASKECVWLGRLMSEISPKWIGPIPLMCDNRSTIDLIKNPILHQRTKHIEVRNYFVRERQKAGDIDVLHISTDDQLADPLTKPLPNPRFSVLRDLMGIVCVPE